MVHLAQPVLRSPAAASLMFARRPDALKRLPPYSPNCSDIMSASYAGSHTPTRTLASLRRRVGCQRPRLNKVDHRADVAVRERSTAPPSKCAPTACGTAMPDSLPQEHHPTTSVGLACKHRNITRHPAPNSARQSVLFELSRVLSGSI